MGSGELERAPRCARWPARAASFFPTKPPEPPAQKKSAPPSRKKAERSGIKQP